MLDNQTIAGNGKPFTPGKSQETSPRLNRVTFRTSREMDFFSERELVTQTGHGIEEWPFVIVKELVDNALDAAEEADVAPVIEVAADASGITVWDNGPGLPEATLRGAMDFTVRASNREAYVSPCRGAQGNALKTLLPMPRVLDPDHGRLIVTAHGRRHEITCGADPISQRAVVTDDPTDWPPKSTNPRTLAAEIKQAFSGTEVRLQWSPRDADGDVQWPFGQLFLPLAFSFPCRFKALVEGFAVFNPHATLTLDWFGERTIWEATDPAWKKWKPYQPTSAHWYELRHLQRLIGAYVTHEREAGVDRLVSDFLAEFDGLARSGKRTKVLGEADLKRAKLSGLVADERLDADKIGRLLTAMKNHTKPVKPERLGLIGENHLRERLLGMGVVPESFRYAKKLGGGKSTKPPNEADDKACFPDLPWVLESAFGWRGEKAEDERQIYTGANWSAAIKNPFRTFGATGEGMETTLAELHATRKEPIVVVLHLAHPRIDYTDRGKSALVIGCDA
jgi:hypothetical protein